MRWGSARSITTGPATVAIDVTGNVTYCGDTENARRVTAKQEGR